MVEDRVAVLRGASIYQTTVCSEVPSSTDGSGIEGNKMELVLEVSVELMVCCPVQ